MASLVSCDYGVTLFFSIVSYFYCRRLHIFLVLFKFYHCPVISQAVYDGLTASVSLVTHYSINAPYSLGP